MGIIGGLDLSESKNQQLSIYAVSKEFMKAGRVYKQYVCIPFEASSRFLTAITIHGTGWLSSNMVT